MAVAPTFSSAPAVDVNSWHVAFSTLVIGLLLEIWAGTSRTVGEKMLGRLGRQCACRDAEDARKSVTKPLALNGSIMAIFERKTKGKVNYSHVQHTREQTKQVLTSATPIGFLFFILSGLRLFAGL
jgi:hypothetical protein